MQLSSRLLWCEVRGADGFKGRNAVPRRSKQMHGVGSSDLKRRRTERRRIGRVTVSNSRPQRVGAVGTCREPKRRESATEGHDDLPCPTLRRPRKRRRRARAHGKLDGTFALRQVVGVVNARASASERDENCACRDSSRVHQLKILINDRSSLKMVRWTRGARCLDASGRAAHGEKMEQGAMPRHRERAVLFVRELPTWISFNETTSNIRRSEARSTRTCPPAWIIGAVDRREVRLVPPTNIGDMSFKAPPFSTKIMVMTGVLPAACRGP